MNRDGGKPESTAWAALSTRRGGPVDTMPSPARLGRVERSVLEALHRSGGVVARQTVLRAAFPAHVGIHVVGGATARDTSDGRMHRRALAEASLSRAISSLHRKGLVVPERVAWRGPTLLRLASAGSLPEWEELARTEDEFASRVLELARHCRAVASRARRHAQQLRLQRSTSAEDTAWPTAEVQVSAPAAAAGVERDAGRSPGRPSTSRDEEDRR